MDTPRHTRSGTALVTAALVALLLPWVTPPGGVAAPGSAAEQRADGPPWDWPSGSPVAVARDFDPPEQPWLAGHRGVDLDVDVGSEVRAPADGVVVFAGTVVDRDVVSLQHGAFRSAFEPVKPLVAAGDQVERGQVIATVEPGHSPGALHWGVRTGPDAYVNPLRMLVGPVVLKPWDG
ncbi:MAG: M23 family metallopeptidase [Pauljensenia sp.]